MDSIACRASITSVLEQVHVGHDLTGAQVVTCALIAFLIAKEHSGELYLSLSGFVNSGKVDQSSKPNIYLIIRPQKVCTN